LKVTLRGLWLLKQQGRFPRVLTQEDFLEDPVLLRGLREYSARNPGTTPAAAVFRGLEMAVERGTLLCCRPPVERPEERLYLLNTETDRNAITRQGWQRARPLEPGAAPADPGLNLSATDRPNIFALYEDNVGTIGPMLAEELKAAEERYPWAWISEAFRIAVNQNKLSWRYIAAILRRWAAEGKSEANALERNEASDTRDYRDQGRSGRNDGEPGRYSKKDNRQRYLEDYQRRWGGTPGQ
jgi:DnaD/phage-associated family protein